MSSSSEFWKRWWNDQALQPSSDYVLNRRTAVRVDALEKHALEEFLTAVAPKPDDAILDAGCGSGRNLSLLAPRVGQMVGLDYSEAMLVRARDRLESEKLSNVQLLQGDVTQLPFPADSFDVVVCASVLQYLNDTECERAIQELVRVCKPGGRLVLHVKNGTSLYGCSLRILRMIAKALRHPTKPEHYRSRRWHESTLAANGGVVTDFYGFGIFTFVPLPGRVVGYILRLESNLPIPRPMRRFAVNCQIALNVKKRNSVC